MWIFRIVYPIYCCYLCFDWYLLFLNSLSSLHLFLATTATPSYRAFQYFFSFLRVSISRVLTSVCFRPCLANLFNLFLLFSPSIHSITSFRQWFQPPTPNICFSIIICTYPVKLRFVVFRYSPCSYIIRFAVYGNMFDLKSKEQYY